MKTKTIAAISIAALAATTVALPTAVAAGNTPLQIAGCGAKKGCNPCGGKKGCNPCNNPCGGKKGCNPCGGKK